MKQRKKIQARKIHLPGTKSDMPGYKLQDTSKTKASQVVVNRRENNKEANKDGQGTQFFVSRSYTMHELRNQNISIG